MVQTNENDTIKTDAAILEVREAYKVAIGDDVASSMKNNVERMQGKIDEANAAKEEPEAPAEEPKEELPADPVPAAKEEPKEDLKPAEPVKETIVEGLKYFKVVKGTINGVNHAATVPYVQLTPSYAKALGDVYVEQNALDTIPEIKAKKSK